MEDPSQKKKDRKSEETNQENKGLKDYARYTGLGVQMVVIMLVCVWGGIKLDKLFGFNSPVLTVVFSLLGVFAAIYAAVKDFIK
jgi:ATP synthase protein I